MIWGGLIVLDQFSFICTDFLFLPARNAKLLIDRPYGNNNRVAAARYQTAVEGCASVCVEGDGRFEGRLTLGQTIRAASFVARVDLRRAVDESRVIRNQHKSFLFASHPNRSTLTLPAWQGLPAVA